MDNAKNKMRQKPPRTRILEAARDLFYRHGIRAVGVEAIAEAAGTNKMSLYRHFECKGSLVAAYLLQVEAESESGWAAIDQRHPGDPIAQVMTWLDMASDFSHPDATRGCAFANAAAELTEPNHPARPIIEEHFRRWHAHISRRLSLGGIPGASDLTDQLLMLVSGAHVMVQTSGPEGPSRRLRTLAKGLIDAAKTARD